MAHIEADIIIIGGGLIGATLLIALSRLGINAKLIEAHDIDAQLAHPAAKRSIALSNASKAIFDSLGLWTQLLSHACPIHDIHVSQKGHFGSTILKQNNLPLGYVITASDMLSVLYESIPKESIITARFEGRTDDPHTYRINQNDENHTITTKILIAADGAASSVRKAYQLSMVEKDYQQTAILAKIQVKNDHKCMAYERFTLDGPVALLPLQNNIMSLIWVMPPQKAKDMLEIPEKEFIRLLEKTLGHRFQKITLQSSRISYPLKESIMTNPVFEHVVFLGNSAHTLHPIAGQGFNLGLRDLAFFIEHLTKHGLAIDKLSDYLATRNKDTEAVLKLTRSLLSIFCQPLSFLEVFKGVSLSFLDLQPRLLKKIETIGSGYYASLPKLAEKSS